MNKHFKPASAELLDGLQIGALRACDGSHAPHAREVQDDGGSLTGEAGASNLSTLYPDCGGPLCGPGFVPENGCRECYYCGRMLHAECTAWEDEQ